MPHSRAVAAESLGKIGPAAKPVIDALTEALKDDAEDVREEATKALKKIQGDK
jgi:HEAT repeat protein